MPVLEAFSQALAKNGLKSTRQRELIVEVFFAMDRHASVEDLLSEVRKRRSSTGYATVYRTLKLLVELDFANERHFGGPDRHTLYDPLYGRDEHYHLICENCYHIIEFEDNTLDEHYAEIAQRLGFSIASQRVEIYANCNQKNCERRQDPKS